MKSFGIVGNNRGVLIKPIKKSMMIYGVSIVVCLHQKLMKIK